MRLDFQPTPAQTGYVIGRAILGGPYRTLAAGRDDRDFSDAKISRAQYEHELLLLCCAAAVQAIESAALPAGMDNDVVAGLYGCIRELPIAIANFLLQNIEDAVEAYAEAWRQDIENKPSVADLSALEEAFGERLLSLGEDDETRGMACVRLCIVAPKTLWPVQYEGTIRMLRDAKMVQAQ